MKTQRDIYDQLGDPRAAYHNDVGGTIHNVNQKQSAPGKEQASGRALFGFMVLLILISVILYAYAW